MALSLPGSSSLALVPAAGPATGRSKLDSRFAALLAQHNVPEAIWDLLGDQGVDNAHLFGNLSTKEEKMHDFFKRSLLIDPDANIAHLVTQGKLTMLWEACRLRHQVQSKEKAEREVAQLPPQVTVGDFDTARRAYEEYLGFDLPEHLTPSQPLFELLLAQVESQFEPIRFTLVTSLGQQKVLNPTSSSSGVAWDDRAKTFKRETKVFEVRDPKDSEGLERRMTILAHAFYMVRMRYPGNPKLATVEKTHFDRYLSWLKGPSVWNFVVKGRDGVPIACPHLAMVLDYDFAIRERQAKLMNTGVDFQKALELAMADGDLKLQKFTGVFSVQVSSPECRALTAPGLSDIYPQLERGAKRANFAEDHAPTPSLSSSTGLSKSALKRAKTKEKIAAATKGAAPPPKSSPPPPPAAHGAAKVKGVGKGAKDAKGGKIIGKAFSPGVPTGAKETTAAGAICYNYNRGNCTRVGCKFQHVCWWCEQAHPGGDTKTCA